MTTFSLVRFAAEAEPNLFREFLGRIANVDLRPPPPEIASRQRGSWIDRELRRTLPEAAYSDLYCVAAHIARLGTERGNECIRRCLTPDHSQRRLLSAVSGDLSRALLCYLHLMDVFFAAEGALAESTFRDSPIYFDAYQGRPRIHLSDVHSNAAFEAAVRLDLRERLEDSINLDVSRAVIWPVYPRGADGILQLAIAFGDRSKPVHLRRRNGAAVLRLPLERIVVLTYESKAGRITVGGMKLKRDGRQQLASLFNRLLLGDAEVPERLPRERYRVQEFIHGLGVAIPPRSGIEELGLTAVGYGRIGFSGLTTHSFAPATTLMEGMSRARKREEVANELTGVSAHWVELLIRTAPEARFPRGRTIRGRITTSRLSVESGLDADLGLVQAVIDHLRLRGAGLPLLEWALGG